MKKSRVILLVCILCLLFIQTVQADSVGQYEAFTYGNFIEYYKEIYNEVSRLRGLNEENYKEKIEAVLIKYGLLDMYVEQKDYIEIKHVVKSYISESTIKDLIEENITYWVYRIADDLEKGIIDKQEALSRIEEVLTRYKLDNGISTYVLCDAIKNGDMRLIYTAINDVYKTCSYELQLRKFVDQLINRLEEVDKEDIQDHISAWELEEYIDLDDFVKVLKDKKIDNPKSRVLEYILNECSYKERKNRIIELSNRLVKRIENVSKDFMKTQWNREIKTDGVFLLDKNFEIDFDLLNSYEDLGYESLDTAIDNEVLSKLKYSYSEEELMQVAKEIDIILKSRPQESNTEGFTKVMEEEIEQGFKDIIKTYEIEGLEELISAEDIIDRYYKHDEYGYKTRYYALINYTRELLHQTNLDEDIKEIVKKYNYNESRIYDVYLKSINVKYTATIAVECLVDLDEDIDSYEGDLDNRLVELLFDVFFEFVKDDIKEFIVKMEGYSNNTDVSVLISKRLDKPNLKEINVFNLIDDYNSVEIKDIDKQKIIYDNWLMKYSIPKQGIKKSLHMYTKKLCDISNKRQIIKEFVSMHVPYAKEYVDDIYNVCKGLGSVDKKIVQDTVGVILEDSLNKWTDASINRLEEYVMDEDIRLKELRNVLKMGCRNYRYTNLELKKMYFNDIIEK